MEQEEDRTNRKENEYKRVRRRGELPSVETNIVLPKSICSFF